MYIYAFDMRKIAYIFYSTFYLMSFCLKTYYQLKLITSTVYRIMYTSWDENVEMKHLLQ